MIERRQLLTMGGLLGALAPVGEGAAYGTGQVSDRYAPDVITALKNIGGAIASLQSFSEIAAVRKTQMDYLKAQGKFPDFVDVSAEIWMGIHDWHVRLRQPLTLGRDSAGRYTLMLGFTALVLRPDVVPTFIGPPYDNR